MRGPTVAPTPNINPTAAVYIGRSWSGTPIATMSKLPVKMPALPKPAMARPIMRHTELGAMPLTNDPNKNMNVDSIYDHLMWNSVNTRPKTGCNAQAVSRYDEPYQPMSAVE
jgi:hypothetical protein